MQVKPAPAHVPLTDFMRTGRRIILHLGKSRQIFEQNKKSRISRVDNFRVVRHNFFRALGIPFKTRQENIDVARLVQLLQLMRTCAIQVRVAVVDVKLNVANDNQSAHGGDLLIQRHKSWAYSQPTADEDVAPLNYLQWKNKESLARWRNKVTALAATGNYPYTTY